MLSEICWIDPQKIIYTLEEYIMLKILELFGGIGAPRKA